VTVTPHTDNLRWLRRVRWLTWSVLTLLLAWISFGLGISLETTWLALILVAGFGSNAALGLIKQSTETTLLAVMLLDVVLHTALFFFSGGPFNPFTTLYLVNIALGTLMLSRGRQLIALGACLLGFASLFVLEGFAPAELVLPNHAQLMRLHLAGMLLAFIVAAGFIVAFMERLFADLNRAREAAARNEKLAALTTLTAGAAHELGSPLGTIAVASGELARALEKLEVPAGIRDDVTLVREQVERCRAILSRMSAKSGELAGENFTRIGIDELVRETLADLRAEVSVESAPGLEIVGPRVALTQALSNLLRNALHASERVNLKAERRDSRLVLRVEDEGPALTDEVLSRLGEPFFTTRPTGQGLGLGVFLARTLADQLGGSLRYERGATRGTVALLELPLA
jgi:two-component system sensor histidine kinase RegB